MLVKMESGATSGGINGGLCIEITNPSAFTSISDSSPKTIDVSDFSPYTNVLVYGYYDNSVGVDNWYATVITDFQRDNKYKVKVAQRSGGTIYRNVTFNSTNNTITFGSGYADSTVRNDLGWVTRIVFYCDSESVTL